MNAPDFDIRETRAENARLAATCPRCAEARAFVIAAGATLLDVPDHDALICRAQSVETIHGTLGHPLAATQVRA